MTLGGHAAFAKPAVPVPVPRPATQAEAPQKATAKPSGQQSAENAEVAAVAVDRAVAGVPPTPTARPLHAPGRLSPADSAWRTTLAFAEDGDWKAALAVPGRSQDPHLAAVLTWLDLLDEKRPNDFATVAGFLTEHTDWPGEAQNELLAEQLMPASLPASTRIVWFKAHPPRTAPARLAYVDALEGVGPRDTFVAEVRRTWQQVDLGSTAEGRFLARYRQHLRPEDHISRIDEMLWRGQSAAANRMLTLVPEGWRRLADARLRLRQSKGGVDQAIQAVPAELRDDPGLLYERLRWRRAKGLSTEARELLFEAPSNPEFEKLWWRERSWHIREALDEGNFKDAYLLAASHVQRGGIAFADAEWLAGWIALRFLNRPEDALRHFRALYENVSMPISLGRAAYWAGRAADALADPEVAREWYSRGAEQATTFYGQLSAARLGATEINLPADPSIDAEKLRAFKSRDLVRTTEALIRIDRRKLAERFLRTLAYQAANDEESLLIARLAAEHGYTASAVYAARRATRSSAALVDVGYPLLDPLPDILPEPALVHAIIRQESGFDFDAVSRAGARGLMQLMPATAKETARVVGVSYDLGSLIADPSYNVVLGRAYLRAMIERFGGHYVLAIAAYNAGPHRVNQWIQRYGHPASPDVDVIDWIEKIPFSETRNYVQRVLEGLHVYRGRLPQASLLEGSSRTWQPLEVWCVYSCGVLLDDHQQAVLTRERTR